LGHSERDDAEVGLQVGSGRTMAGAHKGHAFFACADNYLIDLKAAIQR
jgi:hypothetical protein